MTSQHPNWQMQGDLTVGTTTIQRAGFMTPSIPPNFTPGPSVPVLSRYIESAPQLTDEQRNNMAAIERGEFTGDVNQILQQLNMQMGEFQRAITSANVPARENLEAEVAVLVPTDTPLRNRLRRVPGAGLASNWKQATSLGGGWGTTYDQPGGGTAGRAFFGETGAPVEHETVYADKSAAYKLLGAYGSLSGLAIAAGANFQNQVAVEKRNAISNLMLNEEFALINADATDITVPWGDGTNALAFNGLKNLITTANGTPSAQVQAAVGALTKAHIDAQLTRLWNQGARGLWMLMNAQEIQSLTNLAEADGSIIRVQATAANGVILGLRVSGYVHPVSGEIVDIIASRFQTAGEIYFGCDLLPQGQNAAEVEVLPQTQLPELAPNENVQGYTAQDLAPATSSPQVYGFIVTVFEVLKLRSANHFAKSSGVTAA